MRYLADFAVILILISALVRAVARFACRRAILRQSGLAPGLFESDSSLLSRCQKLEVRSKATLALAYARHGMVLGVLLFIVAFAVMLR